MVAITVRTPDRREPWAGAPRTPRAWQAAALPAILASIRRSRPDAPVRPLVYAVMGAGKSVLLAELAYLALHARRAEEDVIVVAAPRQNLVEQLGATVRQRCGRESVGLYYARTKQERRPVIVCCYQSLPSLVPRLVEMGRRVALFIGDEAHRTECSTVLDAWSVLRPIAAVGFTATPYRADESERLTLWSEVAYRYTLSDALRDGVLVPPRVLRLRAEWQEEVGTEGEAALDRACLRLLAEADAQGLDLYPCISSAYDIADCEHFAAVLTAAGIPADTVHSQRPAEDNARAISRLQRGEVRVLVQVSMLSEGSDFPWLRGLLLRRDIGSAVMAFQFLGRGLRSSPGKAYCTVLDPHRNLDRHGAGARDEALGDAVEQAAAAEAQRIEQGQGPPPDPREIRLSFVSAVEEWTAEVLAAMQTAGLAEHRERRRRSADSDAAELWRDEAATDRQRETLVSMRWATKYLPASHREPMRALLDQSATLPRGAVSDLLSILFALSRATADTRAAAKTHTASGGSWATAPRWTWPDEVELPDPPGVPRKPRQRRQDRAEAPTP